MLSDDGRAFPRVMMLSRMTCVFCCCLFCLFADASAVPTMKLLLSCLLPKLSFPVLFFYFYGCPSLFVSPMILLPAVLVCLC